MLYAWFSHNRPLRNSLPISPSKLSRSIGSTYAYKWSYRAVLPGKTATFANGGHANQTKTQSLHPDQFAVVPDYCRPEVTERAEDTTLRHHLSI